MGLTETQMAGVDLFRTYADANPSRRMHDDGKATSQGALRIVDRLTIAKAQSLSSSWPL